MDESYTGRGNSGNYRKRSRPQYDDDRRKRHNPSHDDNAELVDTIYRILCPINKIGSVLGRGGDIVTALRNETHAKIRIVDSAPGADERVIIIFSYEHQKSYKLDSDEIPDLARIIENEMQYMKPHCPAQDALLKVHERIAAGEVLSGGVVHKSSEPNSDVSARILVPNNQVGCLLGKGGSVIQKLRKDTGATIRILPADHLPPCARKNDELVQISGVPSIVKKALYVVSTLLHQHSKKDNPPLNDLISASTQRPGLSVPSPLRHGSQTLFHQHSYAHIPQAISQYGGHKDEVSRYTSDSYGRNIGGYGNEAAEEFTIRILCPVGRVGGIIGKGGMTIRHIEQQIGVRIKVEDSSSEDEECVISISSREVPSNSVSPTIEALLELQSKTCPTSQNGEITTRLLVKSSKVGCIIGQGGDIINKMRRQTRADIKVLSEGDRIKYISRDEVLVQVSGNQNVARDALAEIASRLRDRTLRGDNATIEPASPRPSYEYRSSGNMSARHLSAPGNAGVDLYPSTKFHGYDASDSFSGRVVRPSVMLGKGYASGYEYPKVAVREYEDYHNTAPPNAMRYPEFRRSLENKTKNIATSAYGPSVGRLYDFQQISGSRSKHYDPYSASPEYALDGYVSNQMKTSHNTLRSFNVHDRRTRPSLPESPPLY